MMTEMTQVFLVVSWSFLILDMPAPVSVSVRTIHADYLVGEPVLIEVSWKNVTSSTITFLEQPFGDDKRLCRILICSDDTIRYSGDWEEDCPEADFVDLKPGEARHRSVKLLCSRSRGNKLIFQHAGLYTIKIVSPLGRVDGS